MSGNHLTNGIGADTGPQLALAKPLYLASANNVWYVDSVTGVDSATRGKERKAPLATLQQAVTNSVADDIIVLLETHDETITTPVQPGALKRLTILGEGKNSGNPMAQLTLDYAGTTGALLVIESDGTRLINVWFNEPDQNSVVPDVSVRAQDVRIEECYFQCGAKNNEQAIGGNGSNSDGLAIDDCTFVSVATAVSDRPSPGVRFETNCPNQFKMRGTVFDGGTVGFFQTDNNVPAAMYMDTAQNDIELENISLLRGADIYLHASTNGHVNPQTSTGSSRVVW